MSLQLGRTQSDVISLVWSSFVAVVMTNCYIVVKVVGGGGGKVGVQGWGMGQCCNIRGVNTLATLRGS